ncbi:hypothetical protein FBU31_006686, partial [Coemansia sp. 'formosensis']
PAANRKWCAAALPRFHSTAYVVIGDIPDPADVDDSDVEYSASDDDYSSTSIDDSVSVDANGQNKDEDDNADVEESLST